MLTNVRETKMEEKNTNVADLPEFDAGSGVDLTEYEGQKAKIEGTRVLEVESSYDESGNWQEGLKRKVQVIKVFTEPITTITDKEGKEIEVRASELFNLRLKDGEWGISKSDKSKIQKFLKRQKVSSITEVIGTSVVLRAYDNKQGNTYLGFITK